MTDKKTDKKGDKKADTIDEKDKATWDKIVGSNIDEQADSFLRAFTLEYSGKFETVLERAELFKKRSQNKIDLDEQQAHLLFEKHHHAITVHDLREKLRLMDIDKNNRLCFVEYCLFLDEKTVDQFFYGLAHPPPGSDSEALRKAIAHYREILKKKQDREDKMDKLREEAKQDGVKGKTAQATLHQMESEDKLSMAKQEITAGAAKRKAEKETKEDPFVTEQKRVAELKKKEEEEKKKKADESRARLAAKAAAFNPNSSKDVVSSIAKSDTKLNKVTTKVENSALTRDKIQAQVAKGGQHLNKVDAPSTAPSEAVKEAFRKDRAESKTEQDKK